MTLINPLQFTAHEFADRMYAVCGRGRAQALALYQCFIREGQVRDTLPQFRNAPHLYEQMRQTIKVDIDPVTLIQSTERATKFLMKTHDGYLVESVIMSMQRRKSLCVSSQIGCRMACAFCHTGQMGFKRHLSPEEIVQQMFAARHVLKSSIQNVVFMGMGEPFDNFESVMQAVRVLADPLSFGIGLRRITISTSGDIQGIKTMTRDERPLPNLAVSLGAPTDAIRSKIMPRRRAEPLHDLYTAMYDYCRTKKRQILVSYVLLSDVNDSLECAEQLAIYLKGLDVRVNVIPYNASPESAFACPSQEAITAFVSRLRHHALPVFVRHERGSSIQAACGQLGG